MSYIDIQRHLLKRSRASDLFPVVAFDDDTQLFLLEPGTEAKTRNKSAIGACWIGSPLLGIDESMIERLKSTLSIEAPVDTMLQFSLLSSSGIDRIVDAYERERTIPLNNATDNGLTSEQKRLLKQLVRERADHMRRGATESLMGDAGVVLRTMNVVISLRVPCKQAIPSEADRQRVDVLANKFEQGMESCGLRMTRLDEPGYIDLLRTITHMGDRIDTHVDPDKPINEQILNPEDGVNVHRDHVRINDRYIKSMSVQGFPREASIAETFALIGSPMGDQNQIRDPFLATLTICIPDQQKKSAQFEKKKMWATHMATGPMAKWTQRVKDRHEQYQVMEQALGQGNRLIEIWMNVTTFSRSLEASERTASTVKAYTKGLGFSLKEDHFISLPCLLNTLPLGAEPSLRQALQRYETKATVHACHLMPIMGDWPGNGGELTEMYFSRRGQLVSFDPFSSASSYNFLVTATSGGGKSVLYNSMVASMLSKGYQVYILDLGRSFKKLAHMLKGEFIEFTSNSDFNLNPFRNTDNIEEQKESIYYMVEQMATGRRGEYLETFVARALHKVIEQQLAEHPDDLDITKLAEALERHEDARVRDVATQLNPFTKDGIYGQWFHDGEPVTFNNKLTVLELEELRSRPPLQRVVLLQLINEIQRTIYLRKRRGKDDRVVIIVDEAWDFLTEPGMARFLQDLYRRCRKYNSAVGISVQSLLDVHNSDEGHAILENSPVKILLRQNAETVANLKKTDLLQIGDFGFNMLRSLTTVPGKYSEAYIYTDHAGAGVARLVLPRFQQLLFSTHPAETSAIQSYLDEGLPVDEAIRAVMADEQKAQRGRRGNRSGHAKAN